MAAARVSSRSPLALPSLEGQGEGRGEGRGEWEREGRGEGERWGSGEGVRLGGGRRPGEGAVSAGEGERYPSGM